MKFKNPLGEKNKINQKQKINKQKNQKSKLDIIAFKLLGTT